MKATPKPPYPETVIGYDCREMWLPSLESRSDRVKQSLLRFDIERRLTIGRFDWNSIFAFDRTYIDGKSVGTVPGYSLSIPDIDRTSDSFWDDDQKMVTFIHEHSNVYQQPFWAMAFSIVQTPKYESYLAKWLENHKSDLVPFSLDVDPQEHPEWTFLGYDVQDTGPSFWEGLGSGIFPDDIQNPLREKWGKFLNKYHPILLKYGTSLRKD